MARPKRKAPDIAHDRAEVARLHLEGYSQSKIAAYLNALPGRRYALTQQTISNDLAAIRQAWLESTLMNYDAKMSQEVAKLDNMERTAWERFEASTRPRTRTRTRRHGGITTVEVEETTSPGDPAWLAVVASCIEQRCNIQGIPLSTAGLGPYMSGEDLLQVYSDDDLDLDADPI